MKKTITFQSLNRCWLPVLLAFFYSLTLSAQIPCNLVCNDHVNASMPADTCARSFEPDDFLENPDPTCLDYEVRLSYPYGTNNLGGVDVDRSHIGYTFIYSVVLLNPVNGAVANSCWGYVTIEDKAAPQPLCKSATVSCFQVARLTEIIGDVIDNCGQRGASAIEQMRWEDFGCNDVRGLGRVARRIRSWDEWGNNSTCNDTLTIGRDSLENVIAPETVLLNCRVLCKKLKNTGSNTNKANFDLTKFEPIEKINGVNNPKYPSPDVLLKLQKCDTFGGGKKCLDPNLRAVPFIEDSVLQVIGDSCFRIFDSIAMYPAPGGFCKTSLTWKDQVVPVCGSGFKVRREWVIADWCTGRDTIFVQYIKVEDKEIPAIVNDPANKLFYTAQTGPHNCIANVRINPLLVDDCDPNVKQNYIAIVQQGNHAGSVSVLSGTLPATLTLPAIVSAGNPAGTVNHRIGVSIVDACLNRLDTAIYVDVEDVTPPSPVCDEYTQTTVDPSTCWARVYARDLDNGSKDNCCTVLHFAVASMDSINAFKAKWTSYWNSKCKNDYWNRKSTYDAWLEVLVNAYVFADYIDLSDCDTNQVVLRVYEACGVPRYDPHVFPCTEHQWFAYNTWDIYRAWVNYTFYHELGAGYGKEGADLVAACKAQPAPICLDAFNTWLSNIENGNQATNPKIKPIDDSPIYQYAGLTDKDKDGFFVEVAVPNIYQTYFPGGVRYNNHCQFIYFSDLAYTPADPDDNNVSIPSAAIKANKIGAEAYAPGNTCSARLYNDCMIMILVDDKAFPICEKPLDKVAYCDGVIGANYEYADDACNDDNYDNDYILGRSGIKDNVVDGVCYDRDDVPYNEIECSVENDGDVTDTKDSTGKAFGWYGCNIYGVSHDQEHGPVISPCNSDAWFPIYCHTWLCLDAKDRAGKFDATKLFDEPVALQGNPNGASAGAGKFFIWDNCTKPTITPKDDIVLDKCGNGWLKRTWTAKDKCNNEIKCEQKIIVKHRSDFEVVFPADTTIACGPGLGLDAQGRPDPDLVGRPMIMDDECELVGVNFEDVRYDVVVDACYKIVRTWKLIDWCKYDPNAHSRDAEVIVDDRLVAHPTDRYCVYRNLKDEGDGYITYTQIIKIVDEEAPSVTTADTTICLFSGSDADCSAPNFSVPFTADDNCTNDDEISFRWELDANASAADIASKTYNKSSIDAKSPANVSSFSSSTIKDGTHLVTVIAEDNCGNEDTSTFVLTVKDCKKPTPYCYNGIATVLMPSSGNIIVWAIDLNAGSYDNCTAKSALKYSFDEAGLFTSDTFTCADIANGISATVEVDIWVTDAAGNKDFCRTYLLIQDGNGNVCADNSSAAGSISGRIETETKEAVEKVALNIKSTVNMPSYMTDNKGLYAFKNLPVKQDYSITPKRDDDPMNGVSTIDLVLIQKHILGVQSLNSAYKMIAADVDHSSDITAIDLVELRKLILTIYDKLPNNTSWRFIPKSFDFSSVSNPLNANFPESLQVSQLSKEELNKDFVGIKVGDVNGTSAPHSLLGAEAREAAGTLRFRTADKELKAGETATIEFTADNFNKIEGYQFSLATSGLNIIDVKSGALKINANNFGMHKANQGYITTSWSELSNAGNATSVKSGATLFSLQVRASKDIKLSEALRINSRYTRAEAYAAESNGISSLMNIALEVGSTSTAKVNYALHQNTPNPFKSQTTIGFELGKAEKTTLTISDVTGKVLKSYTIDGGKGFNRFALNRSDFASAGVLYYSIETKSFKDTKKMLLVE